MRAAILLFDRFETLDAMGPVEVFGRLPEAYQLGFYSVEPGPIVSAQGVPVLTQPVDALEPGGLLLVPGGTGTRSLAGDRVFLDTLTRLVNGAEHVLSVCTGSALLAASGVLDGKAATSNKLAFEWAAAQSDRVRWQAKARWVRDGRFWTSSGISAGIDMALAFVACHQGREAALRCAREMEYCWHEDAGDDPFAAAGRGSL